MKNDRRSVVCWQTSGISVLISAVVACQGNLGDTEGVGGSGAGSGTPSVTGTTGGPAVAGSGAGLASGPGVGTGPAAGVGGAGVGVGTGLGAGAGPGAGAGGGASAGSGVAGGGPFEAVSIQSSLRKVKNVLTGLAPTDADVAAVTDQASLATLIDTWMGTPQFEAKMLKFFRNMFQQSQFAVADFEFQLRSRPGAFDLPYGLYGDQAFPNMFANLEESVARTAFYYAENGQPLTNILTTNQFMMTTGLMSLYLQVEMPYDIHTFNWKFNQGSRPPLSQTLDPTSPNYMVWGYVAPTVIDFPKNSIEKNGQGCAGSNRLSTFPGNTNLYQVLLGVVPRDTTACFEHAIQPYITPQDQSDWRMVTLRPLKAGEKEVLAYDLPSIRAIASNGSLGLIANRVGFFTTPAFDAVWNTNDSNQHRVTANQALLAALGEGFTNTGVALPAQPVSTAGLDPAHAVTGSVCVTCHISLDPLRQFWGNAYDYNDVPIVNPKTTGGVFAFANVNQVGKSLTDLGTFISQVEDADPTGGNVNVSRFALNIANQLCFFANSAGCSVDDPAFRKIVSDFQAAKYDFKTLVRELFSSPLVTAAGNTVTFEEQGVKMSISRRDQFCDALSNRLGITDLCNIAAPTPYGTDVTNRAQDITRLAGSISADAFSRGAQIPVTPGDPNLFFRAAVELVCENLAAKLVDATGGPYASTSQTTVASAIEAMVSKIMAYPPTDPNHAMAAAILQTHYATAASSGGATATNALRSTFVAACESPTSVSIGL